MVTLVEQEQKRSFASYPGLKMIMSEVVQRQRCDGQEYGSAALQLPNNEEDSTGGRNLSEVVWKFEIVGIRANIMRCRRSMVPL
jgi:hypothetical protein